MQQQLDTFIRRAYAGIWPAGDAAGVSHADGVSLLSSLFIALPVVHFYSNRATGSQVHRAFPLLVFRSRLFS
jgi:hypothetical protein